MQGELSLDTTAFEPTAMGEIEISQPLPILSATTVKAGGSYHHVQMLIRLHTQPVGIVQLQLADTLQPEDYRQLLWDGCQERINAHLREDGLPEVTELTSQGIATSSEPRCLMTRRELLAQAPFVSVIVPTRDRLSLSETLSALLELDYPQYEIIIIDNAPKTSSTRDLIRDKYAAIPQVRYVREDRPGLSWARNRGLEEAKGEIVAFTDDDAIVDKYWLIELIRGFHAAENVACVTGIALPAEIETQAQAWFEQFGGHSKGHGFHLKIFNSTTHREQNPLLPVPPLGAGVNMALKTSVIRAVGGFEVTLGAGTPAPACEDTKAYVDVIEKGYTLVYEPTAIVRHFHRRDYDGLRKQLYNYGAGLTAFYVHCMFENPLRIVTLLSLVPKALVYFFNPRSLRTSKMKSDYPKELTRAELRGMLFGPVAYVRSRWQLRKIAKLSPNPKGSSYANQ